MPTMCLVGFNPLHPEARALPTAMTQRAGFQGKSTETGLYDYTYDAIGRLTVVAKDGQSLRSYTYDAFGNRSTKTEWAGGQPLVTAYTYNEADQLLCREVGSDRESYEYDQRGNLTGVMKGGIKVQSFAYDSYGRLAKAENRDGVRAAYTYNSLGQRLKKEIMANGEQRTIHYTVDATRPYNNLLEKREVLNGRDTVVCQSYIHDFDAAILRTQEDERGMYYLKDSLGSIKRVTDSKGCEKIAYFYDEFGEDLSRNQGRFQPFGFTGYRMDDETGSYFAQYRQYRARNGRFDGMDIVRGNAAYPFTLNRYGYCYGNPVVLVDLDGEFPTILIGAAVGGAIGFVGSALTDFIFLNKQIMQWFTGKVKKHEVRQMMKKVNAVLFRFSASRKKHEGGKTLPS